MIGSHWSCPAKPRICFRNGRWYYWFSPNEEWNVAARLFCVRLNIANGVIT